MIQTVGKYTCLKPICAYCIHQENDICDATKEHVNTQEGIEGVYRCKAFTSKKYQKEHSNYCPTCESMNNNIATVTRKYYYLKCHDCGTIWKYSKT